MFIGGIASTLAKEGAPIDVQTVCAAPRAITDAAIGMMNGDIGSGKRGMALQRRTACTTGISCAAATFLVTRS
jgi:hypothetical protein